MTAEHAKSPPLAGLVVSGENQRAAVRINDFIFMAVDVSNVFLITSEDGDVLVNTGMPKGGPRSKALLAPHRRGPLRYIILTQSQPDHFGGMPALREDGALVVAEQRFADTRAYFRKLAPFFTPRVAKLWASTLYKQDERVVPDEVEPDILVDGQLALEVGGRRIELISVPGGETLDSLAVWLPHERIVFTGNLFGPIFLAMPFLSTLRGDKPRSVLRYLQSLRRIRDLDADMLITGHGEPVRGAGRVRGDLDRLEAAVSWVNEATIAGMNAGKDVHTLMREIHLPPDLAIGEWHGKVSWAVRSIWEEYAGWFHYDSTTALYATPRSSVDRDLVELAGGADRLASRAAARLSAGSPLEAMHLLDVALGAEPDNVAALGVKLDALRQLLQASGETNLSETMWLRSEIGIVSDHLQKLGETRE